MVNMFGWITGIDYFINIVIPRLCGVINYNKEHREGFPR